MINDPRLPKASLISIKLCTHWFKTIWTGKWFAKIRIANALYLWVGPLQIIIRRPWLEGPARQHLERFDKS